MCLEGFVGSALAAGTGVSSGLRVSPAITQATLSQSQSIQTFDETVTNISGQPLNVAVHPQDFGSIGQSGTINFYSSATYNPANNPHGLQNSVQISTTKFVLQPNANQAVTINILNAESLAAGGHYGAIVYTASAIATTNSNTKVSLIPSVASLIFLVTAGGGTQSLRLSNILQNDVSLSLPKTVSFIVANSGNTQSTPIGYVNVSGAHNHLLTQSVLNNTSLLVLPSSSILMSVNLHESSHWLAWPGMYHLKIVYSYAGSTVLTSVTKNFLYINVPMIVLLLVTVAVIFLIIKKIKHKRKR